MLLRLEGLSKSYPGVRANDDISFDIGVAEIHALLGENGAGKSTLVKMIYRLVKPDVIACCCLKTLSPRVNHAKPEPLV